MATIRSLMQLTPAELVSRPMVFHGFGPFREQTIREGWFRWFWLGHSIESAHTLLVGPFRTKRGAKNVWAKVPDKDPRYFVTDDDGTTHYVVPEAPQERALQQSFSDYHRG